MFTKWKQRIVYKLPLIYITLTVLSRKSYLQKSLPNKKFSFGTFSFDGLSWKSFRNVPRKPWQSHWVGGRKKHNTSRAFPFRAIDFRLIFASIIFRAWTFEEIFSSEVNKRDFCSVSYHTKKGFLGIFFSSIFFVNASGFPNN